MYLVDEAAAMLRSGRVLISVHPERVSIERGARGGYILTRSSAEQPSRIRVQGAKAALRLFRDVVGREGLVSALDAHRYSWLFPIGSSLEWASEARRSRKAS